MVNFIYIFILNIIIGAVVKNYDSEYSKDKNVKKDEELNQLRTQIDELNRAKNEM